MKVDTALADRRRVQAMRLVSAVVNAPRLPRGPMVVGNYAVTANTFAPVPKEWAFIDMDPLLGPDDWFALMDYKYDAQWPLDHAVAMQWGNGPLDFRIGFCQSVMPREYRGVAKFFSPKMARIGNLDFCDGRYSQGGALISQIGGRWVNAMDQSLMRSSKSQTKSDLEQFRDIMAANVGIALRHRYEWSVIFNFPSCRARFSTDASGALKMFKDRNVDYGSARRSPILHWVARHWRKRRSVPEDMLEVRKHLRGRADFEWHGLPVTIIPAEFEVERALAEAG